MMLAFCGTASANRSCGDWREKMMAEKIAFITVELGLTSEEAQIFWPVYNEVSKEKDKATHNVFKAFKALEDALNNGKPEKEIAPLLEDYLEALEKQRKTDNEAPAKYRKVLSEEKMAKLFVSEEKFRRQHIRRMHSKPDQKPEPRK